MKPLDDYAVAKSYSNSDRPDKLPAGGYICRIVQARESTFANGVPCLQIAVEIAEGEHAGFVRDQFERKKQYSQNPKWPAILNQGIKNDDGSTNPYFKGLMTSICESNIGYQWNWEEKTLTGKMLGVVFREEQFYNQQTGELQSTVRPFYGCSTAQIKLGVPTPKVKPPRPLRPAQAATMSAPAAMAEVDEDDELPFE